MLSLLFILVFFFSTDDALPRRPTRSPKIPGPTPAMDPAMTPATTPATIPFDFKYFDPVFGALTPAQEIQDFVASVFARRGAERKDETTAPVDSSEDLKPKNTANAAHVGFEQYWPGGEWVFRKAALDRCNSSESACRTVFGKYGKVCAGNHDLTAHTTFDSICDMYDTNCWDGTFSTFTSAGNSTVVWMPIGPSGYLDFKLAAAKTDTPTGFILARTRSLHAQPRWTFEYGTQCWKVDYGWYKRHKPQDYTCITVNELEVPSSAKYGEYNKLWNFEYHPSLQGKKDLRDKKVRQFRLQWNETSGNISLFYLLNGTIGANNPDHSFWVEENRNFAAHYFGIWGGTPEDPNWWEISVRTMNLMKETFTVASIADCTTIHGTPSDDYLWRETEVGCKVLLLLQKIHKFNISYIHSPLATTDYYERMGAIYEFEDTVDIYVKPRSFWSATMFNATPISPVFVWKFGFMLRHPDPDVHHFYSLPFCAPVWLSLIAMILLVSVLFYILNRAEQWLSGENLECYFFNELLIAIGIFSQHYISINTMESTSRRIAFISFFLFCYIVYSYYTSTLLSDLVHDKDNVMDLETLADSSYDHVVVDSVAVIIKVLVDQLHKKDNNMPPEHLRFIQKKLTNIRVVNISTGLAEVKTCNTALLSDYVSLYNDIKQTYTNTEICELIKVHLFTNVHKYFFTSKHFKYAEEFKISILRAKETGVFQRLLRSNYVPPLLHRQCVSTNFQAHFGHVRKPLALLAAGYVLSVFMFIGERVYYKRNKVWPYVE